MTQTLEAPADQASLVRWAPLVFVVATAVGVAMRAMEAGWDAPVPFDHLLHAHSHTLYFGWAGFVILTAALPSRSGPRHRDPTWWALVLVPPMTAAFLEGGYSPAAIGCSTAVMAAWYWAIAVWWRGHRHDRQPLTAIERTGFVYAVLASLGVWVLAPLQALDLGPPVASSLAIGAFISTFAWFFVIGTAALTVRSGLVEASTARPIVAGWAALAWLVFPVGVAGGPSVAVLGPISRVAAVGLAVPTTLWVTRLWRTGERSLRGAALWLGVAAACLAVAGAGGDDLVTAAGRQGVVFFLHALLLGYVTTVAAWYLGWRRATDISRPLGLHHAGVAVMLVGLAGAAMGAVDSGMLVAAAGAVVVWVAGLGWSVALAGHPMRR